MTKNSPNNDAVSPSPPHMLVAHPIGRATVCSQKPVVLSRVRPSATPWTVAHQAPLSTGLSRQEYWSGLPLPSPGELSHPGSNQGLWHLLRWRAGSFPLRHLGSLLMCSLFLLEVMLEQ